MWVKVRKLVASLATWSWQAIPLFWASALSCLRRQGKENPGHFMLWEGSENIYLIWARAWSEKFHRFPNISYWRNSMNRTGSRGMESHKGIERKFRFQQQWLLTPGERRVWQRWAGLFQLKENTSSYTWKQCWAGANYSRDEGEIRRAHFVSSLPVPHAVHGCDACNPQVRFGDGDGYG